MRISSELVDHKRLIQVKGGNVRAPDAPLDTAVSLLANPTVNIGLIACLTSSSL